MQGYSFFSYESNEALHISEREHHIIINCFNEIGEELEHAIDHSVSEIPYTLGFKYSHHLSRLFKKVVGVTPNEYRHVN